MSTASTSSFDREAQLAAIVAAVVAGAVAGTILSVGGGPAELRLFAALVGGESVLTGWLVFMGLALAFGVAFAIVTARTITGFSTTIIMFSRDSKRLQKILVPLLTKAALTTTAGGMGIFYGQMLAVFFYALAMPVWLALAGTVVPFPQTTLAGLAAYLVYGPVLGALYGYLLEATWFRPGQSADVQNAALFGATLGGVAGGLVLFALGGSAAFADLAGVVGETAPGVGVLVWALLALAFGLLFAPVLSRTINDFSNSVIMFSRRSDALQTVLVPLLTKAALTVTAASMGLVYGLVLAVVVWMLAIPVWVGAVVGIPTTVPALGLAGPLAFVVYGQALGTGYGIVMERPFERPAGVGTGDLRAGVLAGVAGAVTGFVLLALFGRAGGLELLAGALGASGLLPTLGVWLGVSLVLGVLFGAVVGRYINDFSNSVIMLSRRSTALQKVLVPLLTRAALTVTAAGMGLGYGLVLGIVGWGLLLPLVSPAPLPNLDPLVLVVFALYGQAMGVGYGVAKEGTPSLGVSLPSSLQDARESFAAWRGRRPFAGALLLFVGAAIISLVPLNTYLIFGPSKTTVGLLFGALVFGSGLLALLRPGLSTVAGISGITFSVLSIYGAFGGFLVGMLVGIVGGNLCLAWTPPEPEEPEDADGRFSWASESTRW